MKEITSIEKYISTIMKMKKDTDLLGLNSHQWFFRGQKDSTWSIVPNAFRDDKLKNEYSVIQSAIRQNPFEFRSLSEFETLTKLQHYGLGTRVLDVTLNPLVALYFATEPSVSYELGKDKRYKQVEKDGVVFFAHSPWHSLTELCVRIAMVIPFIDLDDSYTISSLLEHLRSHQVITDSEYGMLQQDEYKLFIEYIQKSYFIVSTHSNERLIRQSGAFILPTALRIDSTTLPVENKSVQKAYLSLNTEFSSEMLIIPSKCKTQIREELDFFNINEATMFPELEHQMVYVQGKNIPAPGSVPEFSTYIPAIQGAPAPEFNEFMPDAKGIVDSVLSDVKESVRAQVLSDIEEQTGFVDWKAKHTIRSKLRLSILRELQNQQSAKIAHKYTDEIMELLLNPVGEYIQTTK